LIAVAGALFGLVNMRRARIAQAEAQNSRSNAEKLVSFLIEDFYAELEPTGRLDTLGKLAHMTVNYYNGLPPQLVTPQTQINRAMALVREGAAENASGKADAAYKNFGEAQAVFEKLRASGDRGEAATYGLALTLSSENQDSTRGGRGTAAGLQQAADLLRPLVYAPNGSRRVRQLYADTLNYFSFSQPKPAAVATLNEARKVLVGLGALNLSDLDAAASYADASDTEARFLVALGRITEARALEKQVYDLTEKVLIQRPSDLHSMADRAYAAGLLGALAERQHDDAAATDYAKRAAQAGEDAVRLNPADMNNWRNWAAGLGDLAHRQYDQGEITRALDTLRGLTALEQDPRRPSNLFQGTWFDWIPFAILQAQTGDSAAAAQSLKAFARDAGELAAVYTANDPRRLILVHPEQALGSQLQLIEGASQVALTNADAVVARLDRIEVAAGDESTAYLKNNILRGNLQTATFAAIRLGRYRQAEATARRSLTIPVFNPGGDDPQIAVSRARSALAHAIAMQGRNDEAQKALQPVLAYYEGEQKTGATGTTFRHDYAYALYVSAIASSADAAGRAQRKA